MIKERYCSYEVAMLLKEKGFDEPCENIYFDKEEIDFVPYMSYDDRWIKNSEVMDSYLVDATMPTHQMACDWLYEKYGLWVQIFLYVTLSTNKKDNSITKKIKWTFDIVTKFPEKGPYQYYEPIREEFDSQYEATEAGLKYILNKI